VRFGDRVEVDVEGVGHHEAEVADGIDMLEPAVDATGQPLSRQAAAYRQTQIGPRFSQSVEDGRRLGQVSEPVAGNVGEQMNHGHANGVK